MEITIKSRIVNKLRSDLPAFKKLEMVWDEEKRAHDYRDWDVDLSKFTRPECQKLHDILKTSGIQGTRVLAADISKYLRAAEEGIENMKARTVRQAAWILEYFFAKLPHHMIFSEDAYEGGSYVGYYVEDIDYGERQETGRGEVIPERVIVDLMWIDQDSRSSKRAVWYAEEVLSRGPDEILHDVGYVAETPELIEQLRIETERFYELRDQVGKKFVARGRAADDIDDMTENDKHIVYSWSRKGGQSLKMDPFGIKSNVVIDVLSEKNDDPDRRRGSSVNIYRWHPWNMRFHSPSEDDLARHLEADEDTDFAPDLQLPVHPLVPVFDLKRHIRLRVHVNNLVEYAYRPEVADGLVIPQRDRDLIDLLVDQSHNTFQDVVDGKGQSMNILSGGAPGTGKTLTAEVFAEFKARPLYTVQCSQLGLEPEQVEKNLSIVLQRANRWNAILLLDEADVYIRKRGEDLAHNAIVGVFLRVLEYAQCILFMTTNLADHVDDAIASRCIVRIGYHIPEPDDQRKIWRTLADLNSIELSDDEISRFVDEHPNVTGRDVKNLLKLASFVSQKSGQPVDYETLCFALQYKPTAAIEAES